MYFSYYGFVIEKFSYTFDFIIYKSYHEENENSLLLVTAVVGCFHPVLAPPYIIKGGSEVRPAAAAQRCHRLLSRGVSLAVQG